MIVKLEKPLTRFTWNIAYQCNYRCSYCFFEGKWEEYGKRNVYLSPDEWLQYWKRVHDRYGPPYIVITGGEPFNYPHFIELIKRLSRISAHVNISSNSSGDLNRFVKEISPQNVSLSLSFQPEFDRLEDFIDRLIFIKKHKFDGCVNFVAYPPFLKDIAYYKEKISSIGETLKVIPFFGEYKGTGYPEGYTQEERRLVGIDDDWFKKVRKKGSLCSAGQKTALIFPDGKVARCGQIGEEMVLGSFFDSDFKLLDNPLACEAEYCPCDEGKVAPEDDEPDALPANAQDSGSKLESKTGSISSGPPNGRDVRLTWDIHYKCNFRCPYCWFYRGWADAAKRNLYLSSEEWMVHWSRIDDRYGCVHIEITGGEPFLYPNFIELVKSLSAIHTVKVTTNLSGDIETFAGEIDPERVNLDLNFHELFIDLDTVTKKALILKNNGFKAGICYLAYPPQMQEEKIRRLDEHFRNLGIGFALAAFWGEYQGKRYPESYSASEREFMRPFLGDIDRLTYHLNAESPRGKLCNAGHMYAGVHSNGDVVRCGPLADKVIGNIRDEDFRLLDKPLPCEADTCPCNEYVNLV